MSNASKIEALQDQIRVLQLEDEMRVRKEERDRILAKRQVAKNQPPLIEHNNIKALSPTPKSKRGFFSGIFKSGSKPSGNVENVVPANDAAKVVVGQVETPVRRGGQGMSPPPSMKSPPLQSPRRPRPVRRQSNGPQTLAPLAKSPSRLQKKGQPLRRASSSVQVGFGEELDQMRSPHARAGPHARAKTPIRHDPSVGQQGPPKFDPSTIAREAAAAAAVKKEQLRPSSRPVAAQKQQGTPRPTPGSKPYEYEAQAPFNYNKKTPYRNNHEQENRTPNMQHFKSPARSKTQRSSSMPQHPQPTNRGAARAPVSNFALMLEELKEKQAAKASLVEEASNWE